MRFFKWLWKCLVRWWLNETPSKLRQWILLKGYDQVEGHLGRLIDLQPIAVALKIEFEEARRLARYMVGKRWFETQHVPDGQVMLAIAGVEEVERLQLNFMHRFPTDHPILYALLIAGFSYFLTRGGDYLFKVPPPAPAVPAPIVIPAPVVNFVQPPATPFRPMPPPEKE